MLIGMFVVDPFTAPADLKPENFLLRHQLKIALRRAMPEDLLRKSR
jgi:hypothetical protein